MAPIIDAATGPPRVGAVVVNYRTPALTLACVAALEGERSDVAELRIVVVDGGSGDGSAERLRVAISDGSMDDRVSLLALPINGGFGYANNQAILALTEHTPPPDQILLINPDARIRRGALAKLVRTLAENPRAGAVGGALEGEDGRPQGSAFVFPSVRGELHRGARTAIIRRLLRQPEPSLAPAVASRVPWVTGAAVLLRVAALRDVGLFDDGFFLYFEEVELMHRLSRAGWQIWHEPAARVVHIGGAATDIRWGDDGFHKRMPLPRYWYRSRRRYFARTGGILRTLAATLAFVGGRLIWQARRLVDRRPDHFPLRGTRDLLRHSLWPPRGDRMPLRLPRIGDAPGAPPRWTLDRDGRT